MHKICKLQKMNRQQDQRPSTGNDTDDSDSPRGFGFGDFLTASNTHSSSEVLIVKSERSDNSHPTSRSTPLRIFQNSSFHEFSSTLSTNLQNRLIGECTEVIYLHTSHSVDRQFKFLSFGLRRFIFFMHTNDLSCLSTSICWKISNKSIGQLTLLLIDDLCVCFTLWSSKVFPTLNT